jgi:HEAT repeat protein
MEKLNPKNPQKDRLAALEWIAKNSKDLHAKELLPALETYAKDDKEAEVRAEVVFAIGRIGLDQKPMMVCPMILMQALDDQDVFVRQMAGFMSTQFKKFPSKTVEFLLRLEKEGNPDRRSDVHNLLALAGPNEGRVLKVLRKATKDKDFQIRHNAHIFLFQATDKLEDIVPYFLIYHAERLEAEPLPVDASEEQKTERGSKDLLRLVIITKLLEFGEKRTEEMATLLIKLLESNESYHRRGSTLYIGQSFDSEANSNDASKENNKPDSKAANEKPKLQYDFSKKLAARLRELKIEDVLRKMSKEDPDEEVQINAAIALEKLAKASGERKKN